MGLSGIHFEVCASFFDFLTYYQSFNPSETSPPAEVMKLSYILLLVLVAMVTAESHDYYESSYSQEEPQSNYYNRRSGRPSKKGGIIGSVQIDKTPRENDKVRMQS